MRERTPSGKDSVRAGVGEFIHKCSSEGVNGCACERARQHPRFSTSPSRPAERAVASSGLSLSLPFSARRAAQFRLTRSLSSLSHSLSPGSSAISFPLSRGDLSSPSRLAAPRSRGIARLSIPRDFPCAQVHPMQQVSCIPDAFSPLRRAISASAS